MVLVLTKFVVWVRATATYLHGGILGRDAGQGQEEVVEEADPWRRLGQVVADSSVV